MALCVRKTHMCYVHTTAVYHHVCRALSEAFVVRLVNLVVD